MSAPRNKAFNQWKNGFIRHYEPLTSVEAFVGGWDSRDAEVAAAKRQAEVAVADYEQAVKSYAIELSNRNAEVAELRATNLRLIRGDFNQICSHCAWEAAAPATWEQLQAHIQECPSHPIATLKREVAELKAKLTETERLNKVALAHFEKIACLGNGDSHGNSIGNSMAIDAIKEIEKGMK